MSIRIPVAAACSVAALFYAGTTFAQDVTYDEGAVSPSSSAARRQRQAPPAVSQQTAPSVPYEVHRPGTATTSSAPYGYVGARPVERTTQQLPNSDMLSTGVGLFILSYGASVVAGAESTRDADKNLFIPVAGPWMNLNARGCTPANPCGANEGMARALIVTSGIVQGFGALLTLGSLVVPETTTTNERMTSAKASAGPEVKITPMSFGAGAGIGAVGRF